MTRKAPHNSAFTIIEVLISIAIALLLILGINQVFSIAQQTSGAGTTALAASENSRNALAVMQNDFNGMVTGSDSPGIIIISQPVYAFRNRQDMLSSQNPTHPELMDNPVPGNPPIPQSLTAVNSRVHRIDRLMFFTRGVVPRQTAGSTPPTNDFVSRTAWLESYVWYGHLALPVNYAYNAQYLGPRPGYPTPALNGDFKNPGDPWPGPQGTNPNPNNYFASDWILGRAPVALVPFSTAASPTAVENTVSFGPSPASTPISLLGGVANALPAQAWREGPTAPATPLQPTLPLYSSRYDMAFASIDSLRQLFGGLPANSFPWWQMVSGFTFPTMGSFTRDIRFEADPIPVKPPQGLPPAQLAQWASAATARQAPIFLRGCSQFIVEYAGDFIAQNNDPSPGNPNFGVPIGTSPDGDLDFVAVKLPSGEWVKRVRWYGFPRDVGGPPTPQNPRGGPDGRIRWQDDVVPLRDLAGNSDVVERFVNGLIPFRPDYATPVNGVQPGSCLVAAWGPDLPLTPKPKMIRITIALDDPAGRLNSEQYFEYVFNLP